MVEPWERQAVFVPVCPGRVRGFEVAQPHVAHSVEPVDSVPAELDFAVVQSHLAHFDEQALVAAVAWLPVFQPGRYHARVLPTAPLSALDRESLSVEQADLRVLPLAVAPLDVQPVRLALSQRVSAPVLLPLVHCVPLHFDLALVPRLVHDRERLVAERCLAALVHFHRPLFRHGP